MMRNRDAIQVERIDDTRLLMVRSLTLYLAATGIVFRKLPLAYFTTLLT